MKYFLTLLVSAAAGFFVSVEGKIPDYMKVCKRNDPQLTKCVEDSILSLRDKLVMGIPELEVPPLDPLRLGKLTLNLGPGLKAEGRDMVAVGGKNFQIRNLVVDIKSNTYSYDVLLPQIDVDGIYDINAAIAGIPLQGTGPMHITATSIIGRTTMRGKKTVRGGKTYNWFPSMDLKLQIGDYSIKTENLFGGDPTIAEVTRKLLIQERTEILANILPELERVLIEYFLLSANNIVKNFTWDELFPES